MNPMVTGVLLGLVMGTFIGIGFCRGMLFLARDLLKKANRELESAKHQYQRALHFYEEGNRTYDKLQALQHGDRQ